MRNLTVAALKTEAHSFGLAYQAGAIRDLYGVTDGKAVGTHVEHAFQEHLRGQYAYAAGNSASGIDFPDLQVDMKVTSIRQPQSSCPFKDANQKVYGLGYDLLVFVYDKTDDRKRRTARLCFKHVLFVERAHTADYQTTCGLRAILDRNGNTDDVVAFFEKRHLPLDEMGRQKPAEQVLAQRPELGYLTVSNTLQWRLQYSRVITLASAGQTEGVESILG